MLDATDSPAAALKTAQAHMYQGRFEAALEALAPLLEAEPEHAEALYMRAACLRYLGRREEAFDALAALKAAAPEFGRAYQEEGHLHRALGREQEALAAYRRACRFNPALHASWMAQAEILEAQGRGEEARQARAQGERILALPKELVSVTHLLHEDRVFAACSVDVWQKTMRTNKRRNHTRLESICLGPRPEADGEPQVRPGADRRRVLLPPRVRHRNEDIDRYHTSLCSVAFRASHGNKRRWPV